MTPAPQRVREAPRADAPPARVIGALLRTVRAVGWAFLGIRKRSGYQEDLQKLNVLHVVAVGIAAALLLVLGLVALVHSIV